MTAHLSLVPDDATARSSAASAPRSLDVADIVRLLGQVARTHPSSRAELARRAAAAPRTEVGRLRLVD